MVQVTLRVLSLSVCMVQVTPPELSLSPPGAGDTAGALSVCMGKVTSPVLSLSLPGAGDTVGALSLSAWCK